MLDLAHSKRGQGALKPFKAFFLGATFFDAFLMFFWSKKVAPEIGHLRDYFQDIEAVVAFKSPTFRMESLAIWQDYIAPPAIPASLQGETGADVLAAQEQATASRFNEVKVRLASDCQAMNQYNLEKNRVAGQLHVAKVLHEKTQLASGKKTLDPIELALVCFTCRLPSSQGWNILRFM